LKIGWFEGFVSLLNESLCTLVNDDMTKGIVVKRNTLSITFSAFEGLFFNIFILIFIKASNYGFLNKKDLALQTKNKVYMRYSIF
tara:strand:- start:257 stop:511 length:255 start_codon:yes stop_codon:yes gene_type:complete